MTQLTLDAALAAQTLEIGLEAVEVAHLSFVAVMRRVAHAICAKKGWVTSDDLRVAAERMGLKPDHPNVWGVVFRSKGWCIIGRQKSVIESNHAREVKIWRHGDVTT